MKKSGDHELSFYLTAIDCNRGWVERPLRIMVSLGNDLVELDALNTELESERNGEEWSTHSLTHAVLAPS